MLDFFLINDKLRPFFKEMIIDEERNFCLSNIAQIKKNGRIIETDHNAMIAEFNLTVDAKKPVREEMFNFRNRKCQEAFKEATEMNEELLDCFDNNLQFKDQSKTWLKCFNSVIRNSFRKVRIVDNKKKQNVKMRTMLNSRIEMKQNMKRKNISEEMRDQIEFRIKQIEEDIEKEVTEEFQTEVIKTLREFGGVEDTIGGDKRKKMWKVLKKHYPKISPSIPVGKKDQRGNIITNHEGLKQLYLQTYVNRLRNRPIKQGFENIRKMKTELFELRLELSKHQKSLPWTMKKLEIAIKGLKKDKARDPNGLINEIFKEGVAGANLKLSLLKFFNKMKEENFIPEFVKMADVATIYKGKGGKCDLKNDRGIFLVTIFRSLLMRLIYLDKYETLDKSMSDSQVGARRGKNVRNHIWVLNGVISDIMSSKKMTPVDVLIFDYRQCFDSLWLQECMNDLYKGGVQDNQFALLYNINSHVNVAVKTPVGKTKRGVITNSIIQGDVFGPMMCGKQVDEIGQECLEQGKYTYKYKNEVDIPPLSMLDDLICISECGHKTAMAHSYIKFKSSSKKLQFGSEKCKKMHVGKTKEDYK